MSCLFNYLLYLSDTNKHNTEKRLLIERDAINHSTNNDDDDDDAENIF